LRYSYAPKAMNARNWSRLSRVSMRPRPFGLWMMRHDSPWLTNEPGLVWIVMGCLSGSDQLIPMIWTCARSRGGGTSPSPPNRYADPSPKPWRTNAIRVALPRVISDHAARASNCLAATGLTKVVPEKRRYLHLDLPGSRNGESLVTFRLEQFGRRNRADT